MAIARLANYIDREVAAFCTVRDKYIKDYQIKIKAGNKEGEVAYSGPDDNQVSDFTSKFNELANAETEDIPIKIRLPGELKMPVDKLKVIAPFVEVE